MTLNVLYQRALNGLTKMCSVTLMNVILDVAQVTSVMTRRVCQKLQSAVELLQIHFERLFFFLLIEIIVQLL